MRAPIAVPVEIRAPARRVFRLAWDIGEDGVRLEHTLPFEPGRPVDVRLTLPGGGPGPVSGSENSEETLVLRAEVRVDGDEEEARELWFLDPPATARAALRKYVQQRLGLPG